MTSPVSPLIQLEAGFAIGYGSELARLGEGFSLGAGTHFLLARNGRGKTTLLRTLAGTLKPFAGQMRMEGMVQYIPEDMRFDPELSIRSIFHAVLPKSRRAEALALADRIELNIRQPYGQLSTGNRRKTGLILAEYSVAPAGGNILLLDEPFSGLDVFARQAFEELWGKSDDSVLRLVSCHPDYDAMAMPSAVLIETGKIRHLQAEGQQWIHLKPMMK